VESTYMELCLNCIDNGIYDINGFENVLCITETFA
jgi:hypothetical protein